MRPLIGITASRHKFALKIPGPTLLGAVLSDDYAHGIEAAGGIPLLLPYFETEEAALCAISKLDGLLLSGGDDLNPSLYGEEPHVGLGSVTEERDQLELTLLRGAMQAGKPILGICRGIQLINVGLGGSLYQDLPREWNGQIQHSQKARRSHLSHQVHLDPESRMGKLFPGQPLIMTNSFHHQAIKELGQDLLPVAWDDEGLVEGIEHRSYPFLMAVQWHPENLWRTAPGFMALFRALVQAAGA